MNRTGVRPQFRRRRAVAVMVLAVLILPVARAAAGTGSDPGVERAASTHRYVVQPGDTLWGIAARTHDNPRYGVDEILQENAGIDPGELQPGQILLIPG
ncbi:MAG: LysM domain-containing protein [Actinomycetota bacterium]